MSTIFFLLPIHNVRGCGKGEGESIRRWCRRYFRISRGRMTSVILIHFGTGCGRGLVLKQHRKISIDCKRLRWRPLINGPCQQQRESPCLDRNRSSIASRSTNRARAMHTDVAHPNQSDALRRCCTREGKSIRRWCRQYFRISRRDERRLQFGYFPKLRRFNCGTSIGSGYRRCKRDLARRLAYRKSEIWWTVNRLMRCDGDFCGHCN
jgi:hypothetical protein